jgi:hypothetical protein
MNLNKIPQLIMDLRNYDRRTIALVDEAADALEQMLHHINLLESFYKVAIKERDYERRENERMLQEKDWDQGSMYRGGSD